MHATDLNPPVFANAKLKTKLVGYLSRLIRRFRLDYRQFEIACKTARKETGLRRPPRPRRLPRLLPEESLRKFYEAVDRASNLQHQVMFRLLFYTAVRVSELTGIRIDDVDLAAGKIFVEHGKGDRDRYILFPDSFRLVLQAYLATVPDNEYLFESRHRRRYSPRRIQQLVHDYAREAGITEYVHPHLFRHQLLTWLTGQGVPDAAIRLISGHSSQKSLEVYQHLSLSSVQPAYQKAVRGLEI